MGIEKGLVRLCFGLEALEDLKEDLLQAFVAMENMANQKVHLNLRNRC